MAQITLTFNTTATQDAKLTKALATVNAERATMSQLSPQPLPPFATVQEWLRDVVINEAKRYISVVDSRDEESIRSAYRDATDAQKAQIAAILGV